MRDGGECPRGPQEAQLGAEISEEAIALVRRHGAPLQLSSVLSAASEAYFHNARFDAFVVLRDELLPLAIEYRDLGGQFHAYSFMGLIMAYRGKLDAGIEMMSWTLDREHHAPVDSLIEAMNCIPLLWRGAWEQADAASERAFAEASNSGRLDRDRGVSAPEGPGHDRQQRGPTAARRSAAPAAGTGQAPSPLDKRAFWMGMGLRSSGKPWARDLMQSRPGAKRKALKTLGSESRL